MRLLTFGVCIWAVLSAAAQPGQSRFSWQTAQAKIMPNGNLEWAPLTFQLVKGPSVRYIDFDGGDDNNDGLSTATAWKHHPWDGAATGNAKAASGIQTYVFKRGVVYRGALAAKQGGDPANPVRLTSDPDWGMGEAAIYGSVRIDGGWTRASAAVAPTIPNPEMVWYKDLPGFTVATKVVGEITPEGIKRVYLARAPNFVDTPAEPMQKWWSFTAKTKNGSALNLTDSRNFTWADVNALKGGDVWAIEGAIVMCALWKQKISDYNPATKTITVPDQNFGGKDCRYYVENTPYLLDSDGEYYFDRTKSRLFIRLEADKDPNTTAVEVASKSTLLTISGKSNIEISGLTFGFTTYDNVRYGNADGVPTIKIDNSSNITIRNCKFQYLNGAVNASGGGKNLVIADNEMKFMDDFSVLLNGPDEVSILRNQIVENGTRHLGRWYSSIPAISGTLTVGEIAGNIIEHAWGSGINITWGKGDGSAATVPFIRGLIYNNRVSHSLQGVNDYGGIESWQGGPVFVYNNVSEDAQGWHYDWSPGTVKSIGYPFYFDGASKQYAFNNIASGTAVYKTAAAYMQVLGFYNLMVHNDAYRVNSLTGSGDGGLAVDGQNYYLANVADSCFHQFDHTTRSSGVPYDSYYNNFFSGRPFIGNFLSPGGAQLNFSDFVNKLNSFNPDLGQVGYETSKRVFEKPSSGDFRPTSSSELIDRGVRFFAPFPLYAVVGEWHFTKHKADSTLIKGENFYFTSEFVSRESYKNVPRNHLKAVGLAANSFVKGALEDFTEGALVFDGFSTYCMLDQSVTGSTICNNVDMTTNSFILESYFRTDESFAGGCLISKSGASGYGYQLATNGSGNLTFSIVSGGQTVFSQTGSEPLNDGKWHHALVEVNRAASAVKIYIDGILANGAANGAMPAAGVSLANTANFFVGRNGDGNYFKGMVDFLRISKGTLADAKTTIDELYTWEFDGPFLRDFAGNLPIGKRDAGAIEKGAKLCNLAVSEGALEFNLSGGIKTITVDAEMGFELAKKVGTFFTAKVSGNTVTVTVSPLSTGSRSGEIDLYGCNETRKISVVQQPATGASVVKKSAVKVMPNPVSGGPLSISVPEGVSSGQAVFTDLNGRILLEKKIFSGINSLHLGMPRGIYLLHISGDDLNYTTKIILN